MVSEELLTRCIKDDRKAHYELYKMCFGILMAVCARYGKSEEESIELLNICFLKIVRSLNIYKRHVPFEAWIRRIMINTIISEYHKENRHKKHIDSNVVEFDRLEQGAEFNMGESHLNTEVILQALKLLPETSRKVMNMYVFEGLTHDEISGVLGISQGTSKWHLHEARKKLKELLTKIGVSS
jgi:RNA polymerase sigma factor (sigma-70 family)